MRSQKPIRVLMLVSLICYGIYILLYLFLFFTQSTFAMRLFGNADLEPFYNWADVARVALSTATRALLWYLVVQYLGSGGRTSYIPIGIYTVVVLVVAPVILSPIYSFATSVFVGRTGGANQLAAFSVFQSSTTFISLFASFSTMTAFAGSIIAWYRSVFPPAADSETPPAYPAEPPPEWTER